MDKHINLTQKLKNIEHVELIKTKIYIFSNVVERKRSENKVTRKLDQI